MPGIITKKTIDFLKTAGEQKSPKWLDSHKKEHQELVAKPMQQLAFYMLEKLGKRPEARGYKFPVRGFGRLRRPKHKVQPGDVAYRDFVHMAASRPSKSIFDENPGLYFYMSPERTFAGGGLYEPSSRQIKQIRAWVDTDPADLVRVLKSKPFAKQYPNGLETRKILKTYPRDYGQEHKHIQWLRLQAYYVTRNFTKKELYSSEFQDLLLESWTQALKLNEVLYEAISDWNQTIAPIVEEEPREEVVEADLWDDRL